MAPTVLRKNKRPDGLRFPEIRRDLLRDLNPDQAGAVLHGDGPLLIVAGAGTGKTTVLARRIANLIVSKRARPNEILALTFTEKAAAEMEDRVDRLLPYGFNDVWISTFHSFGDRILREFAFEIGLSPDARVLSQPEAAVFLTEHLPKLGLKHYAPLSDPHRFIAALLSVFSRAKDEDIAPRDLLAEAEKSRSAAASPEEKEDAQRTLEVARAFQAYEDLKAKKGFIDFGDQVLLALKLLRGHPSVRGRIQERYRYVLVDEFQDTNYAQFELLKLAAGASRNITVVGDDDQSIYKFRGACLSNILGFRSAYPDAAQIVLADNYRSTQEILDSAYRIIQHNNPDRLEYRDGLNKMLRSHREPGPGIRCVRHESVFSESEAIADEIRGRVSGGGSSPKDFAILLRTNAAAEPYVKSLNLAGIPWRFSGNAGLYDQEEIRVLLAFLRAVDDPGDSASLYYLAASSLYGLKGSDCAVLTRSADKEKLPLGDVIGRAAERPLPGLSPGSAPILKEIRSDLERARELASKMPTGRLIYQYLESKGTLERLARSSDASSAREAQNLEKFFEIVKRFGHVCLYDRLHLFVRYLEPLRLAGEDPSSAEATLEENAVHILTVHAAKGLEFDAVFLAGLEQGRFPLSDRPDLIDLPESLIRDILPSGDYHIQEERRLFYVGMTRARKELHLSSSMNLGKKKQWKASQFISECLDKPRLAASPGPKPPLDALGIYSGGAGSAPASPGEGPAGSLVLPATAVEDYLACPLKYKFARVLRIPVLLHHTTVFGIAVHEALKFYHLARRDGRKFKLAELLRVFESAWRSEGFVSREHEERRLEEGRKVLTAYRRKEERSRRRPALVEESFRMTLGGPAGSAAIRGRWDRVDMSEGGSAIIDFKTGDVKSAKEAGKKAAESSQLALYALAFERRFGRLPDRLTLSFVKSGLEGSVAPRPEFLEKALARTEEAVAGISRRDFPAKPGFACRWCAYEKICPAIK